MEGLVEILTRKSNSVQIETKVPVISLNAATKFIFMDKKHIQLEEQEAPLKNTDKAFVKVNKDGSPSIPGTDEKRHEEKETEVTPQKEEGERTSPRK